MAPRQRVCHSVANARLISWFMSLPREEGDVLLLPVSISSTNRGHSVFRERKKKRTTGLAHEKQKEEGERGNQDAE